MTKEIRARMLLVAMATLSMPSWAADSVPELKVIQVYAAMPRQEVISQKEEDIAGARFAVQKFKSRAGAVCQEYVSSSFRAGNGPVEVEIDAYCNRPMTRSGELLPAGLVSMEWVKSSGSGLGVHHLTIDSLLR